jgi:hypothetical protein
MARSSRQIYWSAIIADFHRSGLTHVQFCRVRKVSIHSFRKWLYRRPAPASPARHRPSNRIGAGRPFSAQRMMSKYTTLRLPYC